MGPSRSRNNPYSADLQQRLLLIARQAGLREIARRTGQGVSSVSRWMRQTRVPASFLADLVREFHVNPAWLLVGEGTPWLSDVSASNEVLASNLLELVEAMNSVAKMRLGSLTGKRNAEILRDLDEALRRHESLRQRLNQQSAPIFTQILADWRKANLAMERAKSEALRKAARQVARLCDDPTLAREIASLEAQHEFLFGAPKSAVEFQRRAFLMSIVQPDGPEFPAEARRLALDIHNLGHRTLAMRFAKAAMVLLGDRFETSPVASLAAMLGWMLCHDGRPKGARRLLERAVANTDGMIRDGARSAVLIALCMEGQISPASAIQDGPKNDIHAAETVEIALTLEDAAGLVKALEFLDRTRQVRAPAEDFHALRARLLLQVFRGDWRNAVGEYRREVLAPAVNDASQQFSWHMALCQLLRAATRTAQALEHHRAAVAALHAIASDQTPKALALATHHRNGWALAENANEPERTLWHDAALRFFARCRRHGAFALIPATAPRPLR